MRIMPASRKRLLTISLYVVFGVFLLVCPTFLLGFYRDLLGIMLIYAIFAMSYDLLLGYMGYCSFGHAAFWGIGGYTVGLLITKGISDNFFVCIGGAILVAVLIGALLGFLSLRTKAIYFALVTFALAEALYSIVYKWRTVTGGDDGLPGITRPWGMQGSDFYYLILGVSLVCFFALRWVINSRFGKVLVGIRENEPRMEAFGYNTWAYKYTCFIVAGVFATIAGCLFAFYNRYVSPDNLGFQVSGLALIMVLIGGSGILAGPIVGAIVIVLLTQIVSLFTTHWLLFLGATLVLVVMFSRRGLTGYALDFIGRRLRKGKDETG